MIRALVCAHLFSLTELFQCMQCPQESTADSIYPKCTSVNQNATYDPLFNEFRVCHSGSHGKYPRCTCENGNGKDRI